MTKATHNYTNPFRKDPPLVRCELCGKKPATHVILSKSRLDTYRVCDDHEHYKAEEGLDVREVRESD